MPIDKHGRPRGYVRGPYKPKDGEEPVIAKQNGVPDKVAALQSRIQLASKYEEHRTEEKKFNALREKLRFELERGDLLRREDVDSHCSEIVISVRNKLLSLPVYLTPLLLALLALEDSLAIRRLLTEAIEKALTDLARMGNPEQMHGEIRARNAKLRQFEKLQKDMEAES